MMSFPAFGAGDILQFEANALELENARTVAQLYERIDDAVTDYCVRLVDANQFETCRTDVLAEIVAQFDNEELTRVHLNALRDADDQDIASLADHSR